MFGLNLHDPTRSIHVFGVKTSWSYCELIVNTPHIENKTPTMAQVEMKNISIYYIYYY
jgi:hypothetical protein